MLSKLLIAFLLMAGCVAILRWVRSRLALATQGFRPGAVVMMLIATLTASLVTNGRRSAWFVGVLVPMVYLIFAMTLYLLPPQGR